MRPFDLLKGLEGDDAQKALDLIALAGCLYMAGGYVFEKESGRLLNSYAAVNVFDEAGNLVGSIAHPDLVFESIALGRDPRFDPRKSYRTAEIVSSDVLKTLGDLRQALLGNLRSRGKDAAAEYAVAGMLMGGKPPTPEEISLAISSALND